MKSFFLQKKYLRIIFKKIFRKKLKQKFKLIIFSRINTTHPTWAPPTLSFYHCIKRTQLGPSLAHFILRLTHKPTNIGSCVTEPKQRKLHHPYNTLLQMAPFTFIISQRMNSVHCVQKLVSGADFRSLFRFLKWNVWPKNLFLKIAR